MMGHKIIERIQMKVDFVPISLLSLFVNTDYFHPWFTLKQYEKGEVHKFSKQP